MGSFGITHKLLSVDAKIPVGRSVPEQEPHAIELHSHLGYHEGDALVRDDGTSEGDTLFSIATRVFESGAGYTTSNASSKEQREGGSAYDAGIACLTQH